MKNEIVLAHADLIVVLELLFLNAKAVDVCGVAGTQGADAPRAVDRPKDAVPGCESRIDQREGGRGRAADLEGSLSENVTVTGKRPAHRYDLRRQRVSVTEPAGLNPAKRAAAASRA